MNNTSERLFYIDPNSELVNYEHFIRVFFEENIPEYKFASIDEYKGLVCLKSEDSIQGHRIAFRSVNSDYLLNVLAEKYGAPLSDEEIFEGMKMSFSSDAPTKELGSRILCTAGLYMYTKSFIFGGAHDRKNTNIIKMALWAHTWLSESKVFNNSLAKIIRIALGKYGALRNSNLYLSWIINPKLKMSTDLKFHQSILDFLRGATIT